MLKLSYTVEKEGVEITTLEKYMISESQVNDLMDSLVSHGYIVNNMLVEDCEDLLFA